MEIINNFIQEKEIFNTIKNLLMSDNFPYYYSSYTASKEDKSDYYFSHLMFDKGQQRSPYFNQVIMPILGRLNFNHLHRVKINCYTKKHKQIVTGMHVDRSEKHQVALYSVNTTDGYTLFENGDKVTSVENQLVLFDGSLKHCSVAQTDENIRVNININLL